MKNIRRPQICEICNKKSFLTTLKCSHCICLDCKKMVRKVEKDNAKCPWCRYYFQPVKAIEFNKAKEKENLEQLIADINWELYSTPTKEVEYDCELHESAIW